MNKKVIIIILVVVLLLVIGGGGFAFWFFVMRETEPEDPNKRPDDLTTVQMTSTIMSNLSGGDPTSHIVRMHVGFKIDSKNKALGDFISTYEVEEATYKSIINDLLRKETYESASEANATEKMAIEIRDAINAYLEVDVIYEVIFIEYLVQ
ncbi:MAG: hypothetical protein BEN19_06000 [Epulopiscium sp. Nuni2H_MBin003]|nr:MAG: hypothetical protein BEN19_06000 [Epulopiscium sp. Nuni2H_MBin003]